MHDEETQLGQSDKEKLREKNILIKANGVPDGRSDSDSCERELLMRILLVVQS